MIYPVMHGTPFYSAIFHYTNSAENNGHPFTLLSEAGVDALPRCDAHLTFSGLHKTLTMECDFPLVLRTETVSTCDEAYEREFHGSAFLSGGRGFSSRRRLLRTLSWIWGFLLMIFEHYNRQCGTIRTPLG
ncbi:hypothetical protein N7491_008320 [Penicillium cf. griseofulvum]|nr:hypothetical protein N7491_008320 [Penicillium cf. griseofulvum]